MASTYSPTLRLELIGTGEQSGLWGDTTNSNLGALLEQAITGVQNIPISDVDYTLTALNGSVDQARNAVLIVTSIATLTGARNIIIPGAEKLYIVKNSTTGGQNIVVKTSGGTGVTVPNGAVLQLYCDGTNCHTSLNYLTSPTLGGTPTAPTATYGTNTTQIATTAFVQAALQAIYPVGTLYTNTANITNPATLLGFGTWVEIGSGKVLVGQDTGDALFDTLGETGGSKDAIVVAHTHALTVSGTTSAAGGHTHSINDPGHSHNAYQSGSGSGNGAGGSTSYYATSTSTTGISVNAVGDHTHTVTSTGTSDSTGSSGTNANIQPYIVVKMWTRTA